MALLACLTIGNARADSAAPPLVNYQGLLTDENGAAIPDGFKKLEFNLYDLPLGGSKVWGPQVFDNVPITGGRFNVILGSTDSIGRSIAAAFGANQRYLVFKAGPVGADLSAVADITPRQQILAAPYAFQSDRAALSADTSLLQGKTAQQIIDPITQSLTDLAARLTVRFSDSYWTAEIGGDGYHEALCNDGYIATGLAHRCGGECQYGGNHRFKTRCTKMTLVK